MANNLFIPFHDIVNDIYYIDRDSYELCKSHQIEVSGTPRIIKDRNYYSITKEQLAELNEKTGNNMNEVKLIVNNDEKKLIIKNTEKPVYIKVCEYNDSMYINADVLDQYIVPMQRVEINVNGKIYKKVYRDDLSEINKVCRSKGIKIEFDWKKIKPKGDNTDSKDNQGGQMHR